METEPQILSDDAVGVQAGWILLMLPFGRFYPFAYMYCLTC